MTFEKANDIIIRRYGYRMKDIPTDEEVKEAEKAFGINWESLCHSCDRYYACFMVNSKTQVCNFFTEAKDELT